MKIKILLLALMFALPVGLPVGANAAWYTGVVDGYDVWTVDSAAGTYATAVTTCAALESGAFLPSKATLLEMYTNEASLGTFLDVDYWSASSYDATNAHRVDFLDGSTDYGLKSLTEDVRCVRSTPYPYVAGDITAVNSELSDMLDEYLPAVLLIFATLFALGYFYRLARKWLGSKN